MPGAIAAAAYKNLTLSASSFGGSVSTHPPVFSLDERFLFCCAGQDIKVVSLNTGETVRLLQSHADTVTSLAVNPQNSLQLYSASINGTILLWDYNDGVVLSVRHHVLSCFFLNGLFPFIDVQDECPHQPPCPSPVAGKSHLCLIGLQDQKGEIRKYVHKKKQLAEKLHFQPNK